MEALVENDLWLWLLPLQVKRWSELTLTAQIYFCFIIASLLVLFGLTVPTYRQRTDPHLYNEDFAVSIIQLLGVCEYRCRERQSSTRTLLDQDPSSKTFPPF